MTNVQKTALKLGSERTKNPAEVQDQTVDIVSRALNSSAGGAVTSF